MTPSPAPQEMPPDALDFIGRKGTAERALTEALAAFQADVQPIPRLSPEAVAEAARAAHRQGLAHVSQLSEENGRRWLRVTVMHTAGAEIGSEVAAEEGDDLALTACWMLAMLLGIPVGDQAQPSKPTGLTAEKPAAVPEESGEAEMEKSKSTSTVEPAVDAPATHSSQPSPQPCPQPAVDTDETTASPDDPDPGLIPLTPEEIEALHQRILQLPQAGRRALTAAFREHFAVPRSARSIGDCITQQRHREFIARFLAELEEA